MDRVEITPGVFLHNSGALYMPEHKLAAISDLHIGFEAALSESGASMPRAQRQLLLERIDRVLDALAPEKIVVVGDLKHNFDRNLTQEWDEVMEMVEHLVGRCGLVVLRGNHDNYLVSILRRHGIPLKEKHEEGGVLFAHGHKDLEHDGLVVLGHEHPSMGIRDPVGGMVRLPCFLYGEKEQAVVLPAMSPLAKGTDVVRASSFFSPILKEHELGDFRVWGVSDIGLLSFGTVAALRSATIEQEQWY